uniref:ZP domain-containing protein n=1 Tax=Anopheles atroparvus TaxID=41427 RepID=A0AAG5CR22_ANOAO
MSSTRTLILFACAVVVVWPPHSALAQSNYASQANSIEYQGEGLPEEATLDGKVTKLDDLSPIIFLNRTKAALNCAAGYMQVELKFNEPFFGKAYADYDRNSACQTSGKGDLSYRIDLPLKGCGTKQGPQRVFTNNIVVRFHPGLEMDGDEIITIVCRYPPPVAPIPAGLPAPIINEAAIIEPPLKGIQILFIICAIMFLTLLLLGLGVSYYCLRRRPYPIVRRVVHVGSGSEITALESGSIGSVSGFKVARPVVAMPPIQSSSGSEGALIPSDYPSESQSENEEVETGSLPVSSRGSSASAYENGAYVHDGLSLTSTDHLQAYGQTHELHLTTAGLALAPPSPKFDIQVRVKRSPPPPSLHSGGLSTGGSSASDTESNSSTLVSHNGADRNNLSTILETQEDRDSVMTTESLGASVTDGGHSQFTYIPELHTAPAHHHDYPPSPPPMPPAVPAYNMTVTTRSNRRWSEAPDGPARHDTHSLTELVDASHLYQLTGTNVTSITNTNRAEDAVQQLPEPPIVSAYKKPELVSHVVDDLFLTTVTERTTIEDVERHKRLVTEYKARPVPPPPADPTWDVTIRNYASEAQRQRQWEDFSDVSSASGAPSVRSVDRPLAASMPVPSSTYLPSAYAADELRSPELVGNMKPVELPPEDRSVSNWDVLIRVLQDVDMPDTSISTAALHTDLHRYPLQRQLSYDDKLKWKEIITTESTLRTMLSEATVREDFERIRSDARYENLFEPRSWDVIIRILAPPLEDVELRQSKRSKKRETWDTRSRRSSLPTLYEYDSDGDSSVRTITQEPQLVPTATQAGYAHAGSLASGSRSRRTSRSSYNSNNIDLRSMSEVIVDFGRMSGGPGGGGSGGPSEGGSSYIVAHNKAYFDEDDDDDDDEEERYDQRSLQRSLSHPSLARSASEFTERWIIPEDMDLRNQDPDANNGSMYGSGTLEDTRTTYIKQSRTTVSRERRDNW